MLRNGRVWVYGEREGRVEGQFTGWARMDIAFSPNANIIVTDNEDEAYYSLAVSLVSSMFVLTIKLRTGTTKDTQDYISLHITVPCTLPQIVSVCYRHPNPTPPNPQLPTR